MTPFVSVRAALYSKWPSRFICITSNGPLGNSLLGWGKSILAAKSSTEFSGE